MAKTRQFHFKVKYWIEKQDEWHIKSQTKTYDDFVSIRQVANDFSASRQGEKIKIISISPISYPGSDK